jgi:hypothetical protein
MNRERLAHSPSGQLSELVARGASGELICTTPAREVHVYLQGGRLAWATDSKHAFAFTRHLQEHATLSKEQFREVLEECRRSRLPVGETLVHWGLASNEQVRAALRFQISCALRELCRLGPAEHVFLERSKVYQHYAAALTFDVTEFAEELADAAAASSVRAGLAGFVREIRAAVSDVSWIELVEGKVVVAQDPLEQQARVPLSVLELTLLDGAQLAILRSASGTLVGASIGSSQSLWCRVGVSSTFGSLVSTLSSISGFDRAGSNAANHETATRTHWTLGDGRSPVVRELEELLQRAPELLALLLVGPEGGELVRGVGHTRLRPDWCRDVLTRRAAVFDVARELFSEARHSPTPDLHDLGFRSQSLATAEADHWCFGAELSARGSASAWLVLERRAGPGLGWAYLSALTRRLEALPSWSAPRD